MKELDRFVGNSSAINHVKRIIESGSLPNTVAFYGPQGTGKTTLARVLAGSFESDTNIIEQNSAFLSGVDNARNIAKLAEVPPFVGKFRIFILDEVHRGTAQFFDVLLKPMEEGQYLRFILCTTEESFFRKYPTVASRCVKIKTRALTKDETRQLIVRKLGKKVASNKNVVDLVWQLTGGIPRDILICCGVISQIGDLNSALVHLQEHYAVKKGGNLSKFAAILFSSRVTDEDVEKAFYSIQDKLQTRPEEVRLFLRNKLEQAIRAGEIPLKSLLSGRALNVLDALSYEWYTYLDAVRGITRIRVALKGG